MREWVCKTRMFVFPCLALDTYKVTNGVFSFQGWWGISRFRHYAVIVNNYSL
jgi:hypothetical protein